ncbi:MAG: hypothetical protein ACQGVK_12315 [Myxococcota bacterium]
MDRRVVRFDHARVHEPQPGFRSGEAGSVVLRPDGEIVWDARIRLSPNTVHALIHHGVLDRLNRLPVDLAPIGSGRDALLTPGCLEPAARILVEADRDTYGAIFEFDASRGDGVVYRIEIDNREYQRSLARLRDLVTRAHREGFAVRILI